MLVLIRTAAGNRAYPLGRHVNTASRKSLESILYHKTKN